MMFKSKAKIFAQDIDYELSVVEYVSTTNPENLWNAFFVSVLGKIT